MKINDSVMSLAFLLLVFFYAFVCGFSFFFFCFSSVWQLKLPTHTHPHLLHSTYDFGSIELL